MEDKVSVLDYALISQDVYQVDAGSKKTELMHQHGWQRDKQVSEFDDFFARYYLHEQHPDVVVIAYRGTVITDISNLVTDFEIWKKEKPDTANEAVRFLIEAKHEHPNKIFKLTGHSLGGALAQWVSVQSNDVAVVFNSPGMGGVPGVSVDADCPQIHNINSKDGWINKVGDEIGGSQNISIKRAAIPLKQIVFDPSVIGGLIKAGERLYYQHAVGDVVAALLKHATLADEMY